MKKGEYFVIGLVGLAIIVFGLNFGFKSGTSGFTGYAISGSENFFLNLISTWEFVSALILFIVFGIVVLISKRKQ